MKLIVGGVIELNNKNTGLGKGLDAIFMENSIENTDNVMQMSISDIVVNNAQPRSDFDSTALQELSQSIAKHGVLQPLLVRPVEDKKYQVIAGERRLRAGKLAGLTEVPVVIRDVSDSEMMEMALVENLQREDLSVIEEALGYKTLIDKYNFTQEDIAQTIGKSRPTISNTLRLLNLPTKTLDLLKTGKISSGHAMALLSLKDVDEIEKMSDIIAKRGLSVRQVENICKKTKNSPNKKADSLDKNIFFATIESSLKQNLGRWVEITNRKNKKGILKIEFNDENDLEHLADLLVKK